MSKDTKKDIWFRNGLIRKAICSSIYERMKDDPTVYLIGEGAHMKVHYDAPSIEKDFSERIITLPISEDANTNFAVGMALMGLKPINDIITADFMYRAMDSICNTAAKVNFFHKKDPKTIVIRAEYLLGCATAGQRPESLFSRIPGLRVAVPSTPYDAKGLMTCALTTSGVTIFFEDRLIEDSKITGWENSGPLLASSNYSIPFGFASCVRQNSSKWHKSLTVVSYGLTLQRAKTVIDKNNFRCDLIDLRSLSPLDLSTIAQSTKRTRNLLVIEPDVKKGGVGQEILSETSIIETLISEPIILSAPNTTIPSSFALHEAMIPSEEKIELAIREFLN